MFWDSNEYRMQAALIRFSHKYAFNADAEAGLVDLIRWLGDSQRRRSEWSPDALIWALMGSDHFDKESVSKDIKSDLQALKEFSTTLIDKLAAVHAMLTAEQRRRIADDFSKYEHVHKQWYGRSCRHPLPDKDVA